MSKKENKNKRFAKKKLKQIKIKLININNYSFKKKKS